MRKKFRILLIILAFLSYTNYATSKENFFEEGKIKYNEQKLDDAKFLFQRSIVFNPKDIKSYIYLAKIYNYEKNEKEEEKNILTALLLDPINEEVLLMYMKIELKKSNYQKVKDSLNTFIKVCKSLCEKDKLILESLKDIEPKNESW